MENVTTQRLIIHRFAPTDLADYRAYQTLPEVRRYLADEPMSEEQAIHYLNQQATPLDRETGRYHAYAVYHREDARVLGDVGFFFDPSKDPYIDEIPRKPSAFCPIVLCRNGLVR